MSYERYDNNHHNGQDYHHHQQQQQQHFYHYGIVGDGPDATIAAYGTSTSMGIPNDDDEQQHKAWTCSICTFHNTETIGRFCSMCGSARLNNGDGSGGRDPGTGGASHHGAPVTADRHTTSEYHPADEYKYGGVSHEERYGIGGLEDYHDQSDECKYPAEEYNYGGQYKDDAVPHHSYGNGGIGNYQCQHGSESSFSYSNEYGDTLGELSNLPTENCHTLSLSPKHQSSPRRSPRKSPFSRKADLEGSFSLLTLVGGPPMLDDIPESKEAKMSSQQHRRPSEPLNEKDFQMSFANWSISDNGAWTCNVCTYVNSNPLHLTCEVCGSGRPSKNTGHECQKQMQNMFETSFKTGQTDFLRNQQEKIEEIEERVVASERYDEISDMQSKMMQRFDEYSPGPPPSRMALQQEYERSAEYIAQLEEVRKKELEEQRKMESILESKRRDLGLERTSTMRALINPPPPPPPSQSSSQQQQQNNMTAETSNPESAKVRAQERLLSQWKTSWKQKEPNVQAIRQRQKDIFDRLQNGP